MCILELKHPVCLFLWCITKTQAITHLSGVDASPVTRAQELAILAVTCVSGSAVSCTVELPNDCIWKYGHISLEVVRSPDIDSAGPGQTPLDPIPASQYSYSLPIGFLFCHRVDTESSGISIPQCAFWPIRIRKEVRSGHSHWVILLLEVSLEFY